MSKPKRSITALFVGLLAVGLGVFAIQSPASAGTPIYGGAIFGPYSIQVRDGAGNAKCLDVTDVSQSNGALLQMYDCLGTQQTNQQFYFWNVDGTPYYQITPAHSWKCLDVRDVSIQNYARVQQWDCLGASQTNQVWYVWFDSDPGYYRWHIVATHSWKHLARDYPVNGAAVYQLNQNYLWTLCSGNGSCV